MICLYYRKNPRKEWQLIATGTRRLLLDRMPKLAEVRQTGRLVLVDTVHIPFDTHDLRNLVIREHIANRLCKELLPETWKPIKVKGKRAWRKVDKRQLELFSG